MAFLQDYLWTDVPKTDSDQSMNYHKWNNTSYSDSHGVRKKYETM